MRLYHVGMNLSNESYERQQSIQKVLSTHAVDWVRYAKASWIVLAQNADKLHIALRETVVGDEQFLILPIDMHGDRQGLLSKWIWDWIDVDRSQSDWRARVAEITKPLQPQLNPPPYLGLSGILALLPPPDKK